MWQGETEEMPGVGRSLVVDQEEELNGRRAGALTTMYCLRRQPSLTTATLQTFVGRHVQRCPKEGMLNKS